MQFNVASRKMVDRTSTCVRHLKDRIFRPEARSSAKDVSCAGGASSWDMLPPAACLSNASSSVCARFVHSSFCKDRCPVNAVCWTPEGRRLQRSICEARAASDRGGRAASKSVRDAAARKQAARGCWHALARHAMVRAGPGWGGGDGSYIQVQHQTIIRENSCQSRRRSAPSDVTAIFICTLKLQLGRGAARRSAF